MSGPGDTYKKVKERRKSAPVKRVVVSAEAKKAYEDQLRERDAKQRDYGAHLPADKAR